MVVCKYYIQGTCRFGYNCRFEHPRGGGGGHDYNQNYGAGGGRSYSGGQNRFQALSQDTGQQDVVDTIAAEVDLMMKSKMWPFSCYGLTKDSEICISGLEDTSPEEVRYECYQAKNAGNFAEFERNLNLAYQKYQRRKEELKNPTAAIRRLVHEEINAKKNSVKGSSSSSLFGNQSRGSLFGNSGQSSSASLFGSNTTSLFNKQNQSSENLFGASSTSNVFGTSTQSQPFGIPASQGTSLFGGSKQTSTTGLFGKHVSNTNDTGLFTQKDPSKFSGFSTPLSKQEIPSSSAEFGNHSVAPQTVFGGVSSSSFTFGQKSPETGFGSTSSGQSLSQPLSNVAPVATTVENEHNKKSSDVQMSLYSNIIDLSVEEKEQFDSQKFTLGKIPTKPPPKELCA